MATAYTISKIFKNIKNNKLDQNIELINSLNLDFSFANIQHIFANVQVPAKHRGFKDYITGSDLSSEEKSIFFLSVLKTLTRENQLVLTNTIIDYDFNIILNTDVNPLLNYFFEEKLLLPPFNSYKIERSLDLRNPLLKEKDYVIELIERVNTIKLSKESLDILKNATESFEDEQLTYYLKTALNNMFFRTKNHEGLIDYCLKSDLPLFYKKSAMIKALSSSIEQDISFINEYFTPDELVEELLPININLNNKQQKALLSINLSYSQVFQFMKNNGKKEQYSIEENNEIFNFKIKLIEKNAFPQELKSKLCLQAIKSQSFINSVYLEEALAEVIKTPSLINQLVNFAFDVNSAGYKVIDFLIKQNIDFVPPNNAISEKLKHYYGRFDIQQKSLNPEFIQKNNVIHIFNAINFGEKTEEEKQKVQQLFLTILPFVVEKLQSESYEDFNSFISKLDEDKLLKTKINDELKEKLSPFLFVNVDNKRDILSNISSYVFNNPKILEQVKNNKEFIEFSKKMINSIHYLTYYHKGFYKNTFLSNLLQSQWTEHHYQFLKNIEFNVNEKIMFTEFNDFEKTIHLSTDDNYSFKKEKDQSNHYLSLIKKNNDLLLCDEMIDIIKQVKKGMVSLEQALIQIEKKKETLLGENVCL